ncbi:tyrosine-type recombinase/integrase [Haloarcula sp. JP-Z28]|uniref:tyrosine-type recombinase/integrase n=1 Tax=Haloarcula sp. JP-Z28 TaxID=2716715 RepID=UPI0014044ADF|nr:tyrosine-type recombinase/integrase [Haloarcula sp. JP-Z28]NHN65255.1 tyrosine-type recombinase/integrase [Haloarcula sp. JP-Z28]
MSDMSDIDDRKAKRVIKTLGADNEKSENSIATWQSDARQFVQWYAENGSHESAVDAEKFEIVDFLEYCDENFHPNTVASRHGSVKKFFGLVAGEYLDFRDDNPFTKVEEIRSQPNEAPMQKEQSKGFIPHITADEKEQLAENIPNPRVRNELLIRMLWQTGMREHEIRNLKINHIDREQRIITVHSSKTGTRKVAYQQNVDTLLTQWLDGGYRDRFASATDSPYVFVSRKNEQLAKSRVNDVVKKGAKAAGIQESLGTDAAGKERWKITTHCLRHSFAIQSLRNGMNLRYLQELMGHEKLETTEKYLIEVESDAVEQLKHIGPGTEETE